MSTVAWLLGETLDLLPDAAVLVDEQQRIVVLNGVACELFGYTSAELIGEPLDVLLPVGVSERHRAQVEAFAAGSAVARPMSERRTLQARRRSGEVFDVEITIGQTRIEGRALLSAVIRDVSDQRRNEATRAAIARRVHALLRNASDGILVSDAGGTITYASSYAERLTGVPTTELLGTSGTELIHPDDLANTIESVDDALANPGVSVAYEVRVRHRDGGWIWVESTVTNLLDDPDVCGVVANFRDISPRKIAEGQRESVARLGMDALNGCDIQRLAGTAVALMVESLDADAAAILEYDNHDSDELLVRACVGWPQSSIGQRVPAPNDSPSRQVLSGGKPLVVNDCATEPLFPTKGLVDATGIRSSVCVPIGSNGYPWGIASVTSREPDKFCATDADFVQAIANVLASAIERDRTQEVLSRQALHDPLTGLANRPLVVNRIESDLASSRRSDNTDVVVQFIDIDNVKQINDSFGHDTGDEFLREVARRLQSAVRDEDAVGRFGGDEFVIVARQHRGTDSALGFVDRVQAVLREPYRIDGREFFATASIGIAISSSHTKDAASLLRDADAAMFQAKIHGRDRYEIFDRAVRIEHLKRIAIERDLGEALTNDELCCYFQPVVDSTDDNVVGFEALARWAHPRRGLISPSEFISVAEETGLILPVGRWMINTACAQLGRWQHDLERSDLGMSVNLSPRQLLDPELIGCIQHAIEFSQIRPSTLRLEITETVVIEDLAHATGALQAIAALGIGLVIDDFGVGYSSLGYIKNLPVNCIKIDRSFVTDICNNPTDRAIVAAVAALANELDICTVAEGVETPEQLAAVRALGCTLIQGYLYSKPLPAPDLDRWLREPPSGRQSLVTSTRPNTLTASPL